MKIALFVLLMLGGRVLTGVASAPKTNWFMSLVPDGERGRFTADKEIVSLLSGIVFSFSMGALNDYFHKIGRSDIAFVICGFTIFSLAVIHMLTLLLSREKPVERQSQAVEKQMLLLMRDKTLWLIIVAGALSAIAQNSVTPFLGTYQNKELGFTLAFVSLISAVGSIVRAVVSHPIGYLADRTSFSKVLQLCLLIEGTGYLVLLLTKPANGHVLYVVYLILNAVAMAGINGGFMNLLFDYVAPERRVGALALQSIVSGTVGFLTTLVASRFVEYVQESGNQVFGISIYAQQALAVIGLAVCLLNVLYLRLVVGRSQRPASSDTV
jgi:MFS family permease